MLDWQQSQGCIGLKCWGGLIGLASLKELADILWQVNTCCGLSQGTGHKL